MKKIFVLLFCIFLPIRGWCIVTNPWIMADPVRSLIGILAVLRKWGDKPEMGAQLNVTEEEVAALMDGDESYIEEEGTGTPAGAVPIATFDYIKEEVLDSDKKTPYAKLNGKISDGDMTAVVKQMFFIATSDEATDEKKKEIEKTRTDYLTTIGKEYVKMAYGIQQKLIEDMSSISADINGNGSIGAVSGMDQTWKAVNRALITDIAMQIQLMELDAAKFLSVQPFVLMTETQPVSADENSNPDENKEENPDENGSEDGGDS